MDNQGATSVEMTCASPTVERRSTQFDEVCRENFERQHPTWQWGTETICLPEAIDGQKGYFIHATDMNAPDYDPRLVLQFHSHISGGEAERKVLRAFQENARIGGVLVHSIDTKVLYNGVKKHTELADNIKNLCFGEDERIWRGKSKTLELDFLLLHPHLGIVIIEVKSGQAFRIYEGRVMTTRAYKKAKEQLKLWEERMPILYEALTGNECRIPLSTVYCFPNHQGNVEPQFQSQTWTISTLSDTTYSFLGEREMNQFEDFWAGKISQHLSEYKKNEPFLAIKHVDYFTDQDFRKFIYLLCGSLNSEVQSSAKTAVKISQMLDFQSVVDPNIKRKKLGEADDSIQTQPQQLNGNQVRLTWNGVRDRILSLNTEQVDVRNLVRNGKNVVIFGPPGSGKTILIMILAKEAAQKHKTGKVVVFLSSDQLVKKYETFFKNNNENQKRQIVINPLRLNKENWKSKFEVDDVFSDEDFTGKWLPLRGSPVHTTTVTAITIGGSQEPKLRVEKQLHEKILDNQYKVCTLKSVMRNTKSIFDHYMPVFPSNIIQSKERVLSKKYWNRPVGIFFTRQSVKTIDQKNLLSNIKLSLHRIEANIQSSAENVERYRETSGTETGEQYLETSFIAKMDQQVLTAEVSNNIQVVLGHNIQGQVVKNYKYSNLKMCCQRILHCIHQLYKDSRSTETESINVSSSTVRLKSDLKWKDIAIIVAHKPVSNQITKINKFLFENRIPHGSILDQMKTEAKCRIEATDDNDTSIVAVDSSANVLSFEWPVVFVIDATDCPHSTEIASRIIPFSRAKSLLYVLETSQCNESCAYRGAIKIYRQFRFRNLLNLFSEQGDVSIRDRKMDFANYTNDSFSSSSFMFFVLFLKYLPLLQILALFVLLGFSYCSDKYLSFDYCSYNDLNTYAFLFTYCIINVVLILIVNTELLQLFKPIFLCFHSLCLLLYFIVLFINGSFTAISLFIQFAVFIIIMLAVIFLQKWRISLFLWYSIHHSFIVINIVLLISLLSSLLSFYLFPDFTLLPLALLPLYFVAWFFTLSVCRSMKRNIVLNPGHNDVSIA